MYIYFCHTGSPVMVVWGYWPARKEETQSLVSHWFWSSGRRVAERKYETLEFFFYSKGYRKPKQWPQKQSAPLCQILPCPVKELNQLEGIIKKNMSRNFSLFVPKQFHDQKLLQRQRHGDGGRTCCLALGLKRAWYRLSSTFRRLTISLRVSFSSTSSWACRLKSFSSASLPAGSLQVDLHSEPSRMVLAGVAEQITKNK